MKKTTVEAQNPSESSLEEALRLKDIAAKLRAKADESKLCIEVAQQSVSKMIVAAAKDEKAALDAENAAKQAGIDARLRMEHELNMPHADALPAQEQKKADATPPKTP